MWKSLSHFSPDDRNPESHARELNYLTLLLMNSLQDPSPGASHPAVSSSKLILPGDCFCFLTASYTECNLLSCQGIRYLGNKSALQLYCDQILLKFDCCPALYALSGLV